MSLALTLSHQVERGYGGSRLTTDLLVPATRLLMQPIGWPRSSGRPACVRVIAARLSSMGLGHTLRSASSQLDTGHFSSHFHALWLATVRPPERAKLRQNARKHQRCQPV